MNGQQYNPDEHATLQQEVLTLSKEKSDLEKKVAEINLQISQKQRSIDDLETLRRKIVEQNRRKEEYITYSKKIISEKILNNDNYPVPLRVAMILYLQDYYLTLITINDSYDGSKNHNDQMEPLYRMERQLLKIGICLEVFNAGVFKQAVLGKVVNKSNLRYSDEEMAEKAMFGWDIATFWTRVRHQTILSVDEAFNLFNELIRSHKSNVPDCRKALNMCHEILFNQRVWVEVKAE